MNLIQLHVYKQIYILNERSEAWIVVMIIVSTNLIQDFNIQYFNTSRYVLRALWIFIKIKM